MLTRRLRRIIEWHFNNYAADRVLYGEQVDEIVYGGLTANYSAMGGHSVPGNPTEHKGLLLYDLNGTRDWTTVVRNTFNAFRFKPEYDIMIARYADHVPYQDLIKGGRIEERTYWRWREGWLEYAYGWAKTLKLL